MGKTDNPSPVVGKVRELSRDEGRFERKTNLTPNSDDMKPDEGCLFCGFSCSGQLWLVAQLDYYLVGGGDPL